MGSTAIMICLWIMAAGVWAVVAVLVLIWRSVMGNSLMLYHNTESLSRNTSKLESLRQKLQGTDVHSGQLEATMADAAREVKELAQSLREKKNGQRSAADKLTDETYGRKGI